MFFAHIFEEEFCDGRGRGSLSLCGGARHRLLLVGAYFGREPRPSGGHASPGGSPCVLGVLCEGGFVCWGWC